MGTGKNRPGVKATAGDQAPTSGETPARPRGTKKAAPARRGAVVRREAPAPAKMARGKATARRAAARIAADPGLFEPLSEGERADALRLLLADKRLARMAKIGRYRVIAAEPLPLGDDHALATHRLARLVAYDYAADACVEAAIDLDDFAVAHLHISKAQPMLSAEEELAAIDVASADERVSKRLALGDVAQAAMHYWSDRESDLAHRRRSAVVLFGPPGSRPTLVAVVDLLDAAVTEITAAGQW